MKITANKVISTLYSNPKQDHKSVNKNHYENQSNAYTLQLDVLPIYFTGNIKIPDEKILIKKLTKFVDDLLATKNPEESTSDFIENTIRKAIGFIKYKKTTSERLKLEILSLVDNKMLNKQQKISRMREIEKELVRIKKMKFESNSYKKATPKNSPEDNLDYILLNKFKSSILANEYSLDTVYKNYYLPLNEVRTVEELKGKFPKIRVIKNPVDVIAKKMRDNITRDFYEGLYDVMQEKNDDKTIKYLEKYFQNLSDLYAKFIDKDTFEKKLLVPLADSVLAKYKDILKSGSFSSIPEQRKSPTAALSKDDLDLIKVNYDDFVTFVIRQLYLEGKKPNEIIYKLGDTEIAIGKINDKNYKFKKPDEKIKKILNDAREIENSRRAYECFDATKLQERLNYYANSDFAINDTILESLVNFGSCKFEKEDIEQMIKLLRELDKSKDGKISIEEVAQNIVKHDIKPRGTQKLNKIELEKIEQELKLKQKDASRLAYVQENFDNAINILYMNNMNEMAEICSKYRPTSLNSNHDSDFVMDLLMKHIDNADIKDKDILKKKLLRWDTYKIYNEIDPDSNIINKALEYSNGDEIKAGQYIINFKLIENYPQVPSDYPYCEVIEKLFERVSGKNFEIKQNLITLYLCKFDDCMSLNDNNRRLLLNLLEKFDLNDDIDKILLKYIFENDYLCNKTKISINDTNRIAVLDPKAKQEIYDTYKYPNSLLLIRQFEEAMSNFTGPKGTAGIKHLGINNESLKGYYEVKIMGNSGDRLETSAITDSEEIIFDTFIPKGRH